MDHLLHKRNYISIDQGIYSRIQDCDAM